MPCLFLKHRVILCLNTIVISFFNWLKIVIFMLFKRLYRLDLVIESVKKRWRSRYRRRNEVIQISNLDLAFLKKNISYDRLHLYTLPCHLSSKKLRPYHFIIMRSLWLIKQLSQLYWLKLGQRHYFQL